MKALSVRQPWAWAIAHGRKDVENRTWPTQWHGRLAIHASARWDEDGAWDWRVMEAALSEEPVQRDDRFVLSAVIAVADLVDVARGVNSLWAEPGQFHWRLANVRPLAEPMPCKGRLGLWDLPDDVEAAVVAHLAATADRSGEAASR